MLLRQYSKYCFKAEIVYVTAGNRFDKTDLTAFNIKYQAGRNTICWSVGCVTQESRFLPLVARQKQYINLNISCNRHLNNLKSLRSAVFQYLFSCEISQ